MNFIPYENYKSLRYKTRSDVEYVKLLKGRKERFMYLNLPAKNSRSLVYSHTEYIDNLIQEVEREYNKLTVNYKINYLAQEAFSTCVIEGARITIADTIRVGSEGHAKNKSERMVLNSIRAINQIKGVNITSDLFTKYELRHIWDILTDGACDNEEIKGKIYRTDNIAIFDSAQKEIFKAPLVKCIDEMMNRLFDFMRSNFINPIIAAIVVHYYFVYIHPFCDGNGRMARILLTQYLIEHHYYKFNYVSITTEVLKNSRYYYNSLQDSENPYNDITFFIIFYLRIIALVLSKVNKGLGIRFEDALAIVGQNPRQQRLIRFLKKNPDNFSTQDRYSTHFNVSKEQAAKELNELYKKGILHKKRSSRMIYKWWEYEI